MRFNALIVSTNWQNDWDNHSTNNDDRHSYEPYVHRHLAPSIEKTFNKRTIVNVKQMDKSRVIIVAKDLITSFFLSRLARDRIDELLSSVIVTFIAKERKKHRSLEGKTRVSSDYLIQIEYDRSSRTDGWWWRRKGKGEKSSFQCKPKKNYLHVVKIVNNHRSVV